MNIPPTKPPTCVELIVEAVATLDTATGGLKLANEHLSKARSEECAALNRVNAAQKRLDELMVDLKKQAPLNTDWKRPRGEPA